MDYAAKLFQELVRISTGLLKSDSERYQPKFQGKI